MAKAEGLRDPQFIHYRLPWIIVSLGLTLAAVLGYLWQTPYVDPYAAEPQSVFTWFGHPIERNSHLRLPGVLALEVVTVSADGQLIVAIGNGPVIRSEDGGATWTLSSSMDAVVVSAVAMARDGQNLMAFQPTGGTFFRSTDGGATWASGSTGIPAVLWSVAISADGQTGVAVGDGGTILVTTDGGDTWAAATSGTTEDLNSVAVSADGQTAVAISDDGTILSAADDGSWVPANDIDTPVQLGTAAMSADGQSVIVVGNSGTILRTGDGGVTWATAVSGTTEDFRSVAMSANGLTAVAVGRNGTIVRSTDGGVTWAAATSPISDYLASVTISANGQTVVAASFGAILLSTNNGATWERRTADALQAVATSADGQDVVAVGDNGTVLRSTNAGNTWAAASSRTPARLLAVAMSGDGQNVVAVDTDAAILRSTDGGATWATVATDISLAAVSASVTMSTDGQIAVATASSFRVYRSIDGGATWEPCDIPVPGTFLSVAMSPDGQTVVAVGSSGAIARSTDAGQNWEALQSVTTSILRWVSITPNGQTLLVAALDGIHRSTDGGENWTRVSTRATLEPLTMSSDGQNVLAVWRRNILRSTDGGSTWALAAGSNGLIASVAIAPNDQTALAVGAGGVSLRSTDGGRSWEPPAYRLWPAPWVWLLFALALLSMRPAFRRTPEQRDISIADEFVSDRPIDDPASDRLGHKEKADTLSRFLQNEKTEAPLTIAITGDWGQGKSSLMNLVRAALRRNHIIVSFNAWHHRREHHLFAALLQAVRDQAVPGCWTLGGLRFRLRLVASRARSRPGKVVLTLLFLACLTFGTLIVPPGLISALQEQKIIETTAEGMSPLWRAIANYAGPSVAFLIVVLFGWKTTVADLTTAGVNPGRLMAAASGTLHVRDLEAQLAFRHRFIQAFKEVTDALQPRAPLIFIDDLDRCTPEQVVETLEAINFLVNAGPCYVIMGFAPSQVISSVGLGYKDIAGEVFALSAEDDVDSNSNSNSDDAERHRQRRFRYARDYLEKLVNIEVPVPRLTDDGALALGTPATGGGQHLGKTLRHVTTVLAVWFGALVIIAAGVYVGEQRMRSVSPDAPQATETQPAPSQDSTEQDAEEGPTEAEVTNSTLSGVRLRSEPTFRLWGALFLWGIPVLVVLAALLRHIWPRKADHAQDSPDFTKALEIWNPLVRVRAESPRQVKRFINRVRYMATAASLTPVPETGLWPILCERLLDWVARMVSRVRYLGKRIRGSSCAIAPQGNAATEGANGSNRSASTNDRTRKTALSEPLVVALAALQGLDPSFGTKGNSVGLPPALPNVFANPEKEPREFTVWKKRVCRALAAEREPDDLEKRKAFYAALEGHVRTAIRRHIEGDFEKKGSPSHEDVESFRTMAEGIVVH